MAELNPHLVWHLVDSVAVLFARSYMLARTRAISHVSPMVRMLGLRDHAHSEAAPLERELEIFRSHRRHPPPGRRPHYAPEERSEILLIGRLRGWSSQELGDRFIVHHARVVVKMVVAASAVCNPAAGSKETPAPAEWQPRTVAARNAPPPLEADTLPHPGRAVTACRDDAAAVGPEGG